MKKIGPCHFKGLTQCVVLHRYSLYMSATLEAPFSGISDTWGYGEDHCQLVGLGYAQRHRATTNAIRGKSMFTIMPLVFLG